MRKLRSVAAVETLVPGQRILLPSGTPVEVERVDRYEEDGVVVFVVRWERRASSREVGCREHGGDGRYLGSLVPKAAGDPVPVG